MAQKALESFLIEQVSCLVSKYLGDYDIVVSDLAVDEGNILSLAAKCNECPPLVAQALSDITPDEIAPAISRINSRSNSWINRCLKNEH